VPSCRESEGVPQIIVIIVASLPRSPADTGQSHAPPHTLARDLWLESTPFVPHSWGKNKHEIEGHPQTLGKGASPLCTPSTLSRNGRAWKVSQLRTLPATTLKVTYRLKIPPRMGARRLNSETRGCPGHMPCAPTWARDDGAVRLRRTGVWGVPKFLLSPFAKGGPKGIGQKL
jgi:hypothetical protein